MINPIEHIINIDLNKIIYTNEAIKIKKNDNESHIFKINIMNNSIAYDLTGSTARIYFQKADGTKVFLDCVLDNALLGNISCLLTTQALTYAGLVASEITIYGTAGEILTSVTFNFTVSEVIRDDLAIESTSEFTALTNALAIVTNIALKADKTYVDSQDLLKADKTYVDSQDLLTTNKVGSLTSLTTTNKTNLVSAINENVLQLANIAYLVNATTNLQILIDTVPNNSKLIFSKDISQFFITTEIIINKPLTIDFNNVEVIQQTSGKGGIKITSSNVKLENLVLIGFQNLVINLTEIGVNCYGISASNYIKNIIIENCIIKNFGYEAITMQFVSDFRIKKNTINNVGYVGVIALSCSNGEISYNNIKDVKVSGTNCYGIAITRTENDSLIISPRSKNIKVCNNTIENILEWEALDTHGGENISFIDNTIINCKQGVAIVSSDNGNQVQTFGAINCVVAFNKIISDLIDGSNGYGVVIAGCATNIEKATNCIVTGNVIQNYGDESNAISGAVYVRHTENLSITDNKIINPSPSGIFMSVQNINFNISNNTVIDVWTETSAQAIAISLYTAPQNGLITGDAFKKNGKVAAKLLTSAIKITPSSGILIGLGDNISDATVYLAEPLNTYQSYKQIANSRIFEGTSAPVTGTWLKGDFIDNNNKILMGTAPDRYILQGYICGVAGTQGTWYESRTLTGI